MTRVVHEDKCVAPSLRPSLVYTCTALVNRFLDILVAWIAQGYDLISLELQTAQAGSDDFDVIHRLIDIDEAFLAFDIAQLAVIATSDDNSSFLVRLEELVDASAAHVELLLDAKSAAYVVDWVACLNHNKNLII